MKIEYIPLADTGKFSKFIIDFADHKKSLFHCIELVGGKQSIEAAIDRKKNFKTESRIVLQQVLKKQYSRLNISEALAANIESLQHEHTFTVSCGHQLNIFGGPLYVFYKIASVIRYCQHLNDIFPNYRFIPVHWLASEDHDIAEISTVHLFGKQIHWHTDQKGATGQLHLHGLAELSHEIAGLPQAFRHAYTLCDHLSDATRYYLNEVFGDDGLLILDANDPSLKSIFSEIAIDELLHSRAETLIAQADARLKAAGYEPQVHARAINLFYIQPGSRDRIVKSGDVFHVLNTNISWKPQELLEAVERQPDAFSPNVVLRPLYSQLILPDVAFIGGPAEIAYWVQLVDLFSYYGVPFPVLKSRLFGMLIPSSIERKLNKLGLQAPDVFLPEHVLRNRLVQRAGLMPDFEKLMLEPLTLSAHALEKQLLHIDATLVTSLHAELHKIQKQLEAFEKRVKKAAEHKLATDIQQLKSTLDKLLPDNGLQERHEGWLQFYINHPDFKKLVFDLYHPEKTQLALAYLK